MGNYCREVLAKALTGQVLSHEIGKSEVVMQLREAETYNGQGVLAKPDHTSRGRRPCACEEVRRVEPGRS
ncbi:MULTISPECIES: hypothetical protein [unclassified Photorhabdus]|uniref:hypothetical protein n=1 Tax=unclassified Photorhabdus TaxID=2620880 RepID=UPI0011BE416C|nr:MULTISPECIES: hypothetical protein [unclassified Photorhabdus]